jgi:hypothetical protein
LKTIVIFDGDTLAYRASAAIDNRSILALHKSGVSRTFKNKTELKELLKSKNKLHTLDDYSISELQDPEDKINAFHIMKLQIQKVTAGLFADEYIVAISGRNNFRDNLPFPEKYKGNRLDLIRPVHLKACKEYLWKQHPSIVANSYEADDVLVFKGYEYLNKGYTVILASQDKDAWAYSGLHLYDFTKEDPELELIPEGLGYLKDTGDNIIGRGLIWYAYQCVLGDKTDNMWPYKLAGARFGKKAAYKLLKDCKTEKEALELVVRQYKKWYPEVFNYTAWDGEVHCADAAYMLCQYHRGVRMKSTEDDTLDAYQFYQMYGVDIDSIVNER